MSHYMMTLMGIWTILLFLSCALLVVYLVMFDANIFVCKKFLQEHYQSQTVGIQIRANILLVLIWVQTVCKGYQHIKKSHH